MAGLSLAPSSVKPQSIYPYFDRVVVRFKQPVDAATMARQCKQCGHLEVMDYRIVAGKVRLVVVPDGRGRWIDFKQPQQQLLQWLKKQTAVKVVMLEAALDFIFPPHEFAAGREFLDYHLLKKYPGKQTVEVSEGTRYFGSRKKKAKNILTMYADLPSRVTGEDHCIHLEMRVSGLRALRAAGIFSVKDLVGFNFVSFWEKRLVLVDVTPERLGRHCRNLGCGKGKQSRTTKLSVCTRPDRFPYNWDQQAGMVLFTATRVQVEEGKEDQPRFSESKYRMQDLLKRFGRKLQLRLGQVIEVLSNEDWLPVGRKEEVVEFRKRKQSNLGAGSGKAEADMVL